jgi:caspase-like apoptosis-related cysteine protease
MTDSVEIFHNYGSVIVILGMCCALLCVLPVAEEDHSDCDCFLLAVLSHGEMGFIYSRDTPYKPESLWKPFTADKCPTLAGKPKLFFFQVN